MGEKDNHEKGRFQLNRKEVRQEDKSFNFEISDSKLHFQLRNEKIFWRVTLSQKLLSRYLFVSFIRPKHDALLPRPAALITWARPHLFDPSVTRLSAVPATKKRKKKGIPKSEQGEKMLWEEGVLKK